MPTIEITDEHRDRIETLRAELTAAHAGEYASVGTEDALNYLLDLSDAVDDPDRTADPDAFEAPDGPDADIAPEGIERDFPNPGDRRDHGGTPFDADRVRDRLEARNRRHGDPGDTEEMDLYGIAAAFDVAGRSEMTKAELIEAIIDAAERLATDPFAAVDVDLDPAEETEESGDGEDPEDGDSEDGEDGAGKDSAGNDGDDSDDDTGGSSQLDAMMSLLDTHGDKWREGDGDARYEVDLPDGSVETARTKDDVRALLFRNY